MLIFNLQEIGNKLYAYRKQLGMTQAEVAEAAEMSDRAYAEIERGAVNMRIETILRICKVLHITPDEILTKEISTDLQESDVLARLDTCAPQHKKTALAILDTFLRTVE